MNYRLSTTLLILMLTSLQFDALARDIAQNSMKLAPHCANLTDGGSGTLSDLHQVLQPRLGCPPELPRWNEDQWSRKHPQRLQKMNEPLGLLPQASALLAVINPIDQEDEKQNPTSRRALARLGSKSVSSATWVAQRDGASLVVLPPREAGLGGTRHVVSKQGEYAVVINGNAVVVLDLRTGMMLRSLATEDQDTDIRVTLHDDLSLACYGGAKGIARCADVRNGKVLQRFRIPSAGVAVDWSSNDPVHQDAFSNQIFRLQALSDNRMLVMAGWVEADYAILQFHPLDNCWLLSLELSTLTGEVTQGLAVANKTVDRLWVIGPDRDDADQTLLRLLELPSGKQIAQRNLGNDPGQPDNLYLDEINHRLALDYVIDDCVRIVDSDNLTGSCSSCTNSVDPYLRGAQAMVMRAHMTSPSWLDGKDSALLGRSSQSLPSLHERLLTVRSDGSSLFTAGDLAVFDRFRNELMIWTLNGIERRSGSDLRLNYSVQVPAPLNLSMDDNAMGLTITERPWYAMLRQRTIPGDTKLKTMVQRLRLQSLTTESSSPLRLDPTKWVTTNVAGSWAMMHRLNTPTQTLLNLDTEQILEIEDSSQDLVLQYLDATGPSLLMEGERDGQGILQWQRRTGNKLKVAIELNGLELVGRKSARVCGDWLAYVDRDVLTLYHVSTKAPRLTLTSDQLEELAAKSAKSISGLALGDALLFDQSCSKIFLGAHWTAERFDNVSGVLVLELLTSKPLSARMLEVSKGDRIAPQMFAVTGKRLAVSVGRGPVVKLVDVKTGSLEAVNSSMGRLAELQPAGSSGKFWARPGRPNSQQNHASPWSLLHQNTLQSVGSMLGFSDGCWLFIHPTGLYDSNCPGDIPSAAWTVASEPMSSFPVSAFVRDYFEPGLLRQVLDDQSLRSVAGIQSLDRRVPQTRIAAATDTAALSAAADRIDLEIVVEGLISPEGMDLQIRRNGHQISIQPATDLNWTYGSGESRTRLASVAIPVNAAPSEFRAHLFNADGIRGVGLPLRVEAVAKPARSRTFVVAIGVQTFTDPQWNLNYAENDARAMVGAVRERMSNSEVVSIDVASIAPPDKPLLRALFSTLAGSPTEHPKLESIPEVRPEDTVIVSYSGHGLATADGAFYLFPHDIGAKLDLPLTEASASKLIEAGELADWLSQVDSESLLLVIDACQAAAGILGDGSFRAIPAKSRGLGYMAYNKGMRVLMASGPDAVALESSNIKHGLMTYALVVEALADADADTTPHDGNVSGREWLSFVRDRVPELAREVQSGRRVGKRGLVVEANTPTVKPPTDGKPIVPPVGKQTIQQHPQLFDFRPPDASEFLLKVR